MTQPLRKVSEKSCQQKLPTAAQRRKLLLLGWAHTVAGISRCCCNAFGLLSPAERR
jgi:hypothetical protein